MRTDSTNTGPRSLVVAGVVDVLRVESVVNAAPRVHVVVALEDVFARVVEVAIAEQEAKAAKLEILLVVALDGIRDEGDANLVVGAVRQAEEAVAQRVVAAEGDGLVDFGVGEGLVLTLVPSEAADRRVDSGSAPARHSDQSHTSPHRTAREA